jgi:hypothetical protein
MFPIQATRTDVQGNRMSKFIAFLHGFVAYFALFVTILYALCAIGFVTGLVVPKIDAGSASSATDALVVNLLSMLLP